MKRTIRFSLFVLSAAALLCIAGVPWVLVCGLDLWYSPIVGFVALAVAR